MSKPTLTSEAEAKLRACIFVALKAYSANTCSHAPDPHSVAYAVAQRIHAQFHVTPKVVAKRA